MSKEQTKDKNIENDLQSQDVENQTMESQEENLENEKESLQDELKKERDNFLRLFVVGLKDWYLILPIVPIIFK